MIFVININHIKCISSKWRIWPSWNKLARCVFMSNFTTDRWFQLSTNQYIYIITIMIFTINRYFINYAVWLLQVRGPLRALCMCSSSCLDALYKTLVVGRRNLDVYLNLYRGTSLWWQIDFGQSVLLQFFLTLGGQCLNLPIYKVSISTCLFL